MHIPTPKIRQRQHGALMAAALLLMLVSGLFMSAWISLMSSRGVQVSYMETAVQRRLALESSRQFAWQCAMDKAFDPGTNLAGSLTGVLGASLGGLNTFDGWSTLNIYASTRTPGAMNTVFPYNYTGLRAANSYLTTEQLRRPSSLSALDDFNAYLFMKTYPGVLGGDLFITYRKPDAAPTQLDVNTTTADHHALWVVEGRTVIRDPQSLFARTTPSPMQLPFFSRSLYLQSHDSFNARPILGTTTDSTGAVVRLLPSNLPVVPSTTGPVSTTAADRFKGYLNVVNNPTNPDNSLWHFMDREKAAARTSFTTIDVFTKSVAGTSPFWMEEQKDPTYKPPMWPSGYPASGLRVLFVQLDHPNLTHLRIHGVVHQVVFKGQTTSIKFENAGIMSPLIFTLVPQGENGPSVRDIRFENDNNRRIVIGARHWNAAPLDLSWVGNPVTGSQFLWRTVFINEYHTVIANLPTNVTQRVRWLGGVMTNWTFKRRASGGTNASRLTLAADGSLATGVAAAPTFASLLPRDAWLESYFLPVPP